MLITIDDMEVGSYGRVQNNISECWHRPSKVSVIQLHEGIIHVHDVRDVYDIELILDDSARQSFIDYHTKGSK